MRVKAKAHKAVESKTMTVTTIPTLDIISEESLNFAMRSSSRLLISCSSPQAVMTAMSG